ncbi:MAG: GTP-binding protein [Methanobacterium sp.]|uniref:GTP-binding protein n=1 Tax=Methanobacterium sp. TaxID=2164 RepID=UPI003C708090
MRKKEIKIVVLGSYNSGKTTTLENLCQKKAKIEYNGTTIALDYGNTIIEGEKIHIFGSPGQERFEFMREILSQGLDGAIVVIDSSKGISSVDETILTKLNIKDVPYVLFANKQDISSNLIEHHIIKPETPIIPTIATSGEGVGEGLLTLLHMIKK